MIGFLIRFYLFMLSREVVRPHSIDRSRSLHWMLRASSYRRATGGTVALMLYG
jgi:hypothetical protein